MVSILGKVLGGKNIQSVSENLEKMAVNTKFLKNKSYQINLKGLLLHGIRDLQ